MPELDESISGPADQPDGPSPADAGVPLSAPVARARRRAWPWLLLVVLLALGGSYLWYRFLRPDPASSAPDTANVAASTAAAIAASDTAALQRSLDDAARVNRALREQVLGLTQRVGLVEDGLAGVERGASPGVDAVLLAEADFLLRLGEERLSLFADVNGARETYALADQQLAEVSDPRAASVRQTLALERDALAAIAVADLPVILGRLDGLAAQVDHWPLQGRDDAAADSAHGGPAEPGWWTRVTGAVDRYFRVRRVDPSERASGGPLLRERIALDLSRARLLLLRGEGAAALTAIEAVRATLQSQFDSSDSAVIHALSVIDEVRTAPLSPQLPTLGEARRELARMRGVMLSPPTAAPDANADVAPPVVPADAGADATAPPATPAEAPADPGLADPSADTAAAAPGPGDDAGPDEPAPDSDH